MSEPLTLYVMPRFWGLPNASPFCVKLETWLRMAEIPYEARELSGPPSSRTGKVPYVDLPDGTRLVDSARIIEALTARHEVALDTALDPAERARATAITRMVEDSLYFSLLWSRWLDDAAWAITGSTYFQSAPALVRPLAAAYVRRTVRQSLHGQGLGREDRAFARRRGLEDLHALSAMLGDEPFFLGGEPHGVDATVFGTVTNLRHAPYPDLVDEPLGAAVRADERLCAWEDRMRARFWPDWDSLPA